MLITVDPGVHACGVAWFQGGELIRCEYRSEPLPGGLFPIGDMQQTTCISEIPQVYSGDGAKKAAALIDLAVAAGRMTGQLPTKYVRPASWKGQVPKDIHHARVRAVLTPAEFAVYNAVDCPASKRHNVLDAIALGLKTLGRM